MKIIIFYHYWSYGDKVKEIVLKSSMENLFCVRIQRDFCTLPSRSERYTGCPSRCQTLRQDVANSVTSHHLKAVYRRKNTIWLRENNCVRVSLTFVFLWGGFSVPSSELYGRESLRPTFVAIVARLSIHQTRRQRGATETFDSSVRLDLAVHGACLGRKNSSNYRAKP